MRLSRQSTSWTTEALNDRNQGWESLKTDADSTGVATVLLILAKKERFLQLTAGKGSLKQPRYHPPFDQAHENVVANRQRTVKTCKRTAKTWGNYAE